MVSKWSAHCFAKQAVPGLNPMPTFRLPCCQRLGTRLLFGGDIER